MEVEDLRGEKGRINGHQAIDGVIEQALSASPQNYELWLHYQHNWTPGLREAIESCITEKGCLTERDIEVLYDKYFTVSKLSNHVIHTGGKLAAELTVALQALRQAGTKTNAFSESLNDAAEALEDKLLDPAQLMELIASLSQATHEMSLENTELSRRLEASSSEVNELRGHLQSVRAEALTDSLTGVANRKQFDNTLRFRFQEARNLNYPLTLAMCDIDHFKNFNDTWGHQTGDQVIRFVASTLERLALKDHLVARYGGEEFAIIMPRITVEEAIPVLERIRKAVEAKHLKRKSTDEDLGNVTISFGVSGMELSDSCASLIERSDENLYVAKNSGRNRVVSRPLKGNRAA
jgi:diguanylate cyclase